MTLLVDASALFAQADRREPRHRTVREILQNEESTLVISEAVATEADYLILNRLGAAAEALFLRDLAAGTFVCECLTEQELDEIPTLANRYRSLEPGFADLSLLLLSRRYRTERILTFDERGFRTMRPLQGGRFTVLPADA